MSEDKNNEIDVEKERILGGASWKWKLRDQLKYEKKRAPAIEVKNGVKLYRLGKNGILKVKSRESYESW